jgi:ABC-2 type transport system permease protein/lipopolysaccharide transport system permease protein
MSHTLLATRAVADVQALFREQLDYRELLLQMVRRDLLLRYKQTVMGFGWAIFMPLVNTAIFSIVFTRVAPIDTGLPYPLYAYSGLLAWNFMASSLRFAVTSLTGNANLVTKIYFPREIFPFAAVIVAVVDTAIAALVLVALMAWYGIGGGWTMLLLPVVLAVHVMFTAGLALLLAMGHLFFRDVKYLFDVVISVAMFATSVVYPVERVGGTLGRVLALNPVNAIIDAYRAVLLRGTLPAAGPFLAAAGLSVILLLGAWIVFHRGELAFAENI